MPLELANKKQFQTRAMADLARRAGRPVRRIDSLQTTFLNLAQSVSDIGQEILEYSEQVGCQVTFPSPDDYNKCQTIADLLELLSNNIVRYTAFDMTNADFHAEVSKIRFTAIPWIIAILVAFIFLLLLGYLTLVLSDFSPEAINHAINIGVQYYFGYKPNEPIAWFLVIMRVIFIGAILASAFDQWVVFKFFTSMKFFDTTDIPFSRPVRKIQRWIGLIFIVLALGSILTVEQVFVHGITAVRLKYE